MAFKGYGKGTQHNTASVKDKIRVLKEKFTKFDRDGDDGLSGREFRDLLLECGCPMSDRAIAKFFVELDRPGSGCEKGIESPTLGDMKITMAEIDHFESFVNNVERVFHELDGDKSGLLDQNELRALLKTCGRNDEAEIDELMRGVDTDGDKKVTLDEFLDAIFQM